MRVSNIEELSVLYFKTKVNAVTANYDIHYQAAPFLDNVHVGR